MVCTMAMLFLSCTDNYKRVGDEAAKKIYPRGVVEDFVLTYTESPEKLGSEDQGASKVLAILSGPIRNDFDQLSFPYQTFPEGLLVEIFNEKNEKTTIEADYGVLYTATSIVDLRGNVVINLQFLNAHKTYGLMLIKEKKDD